MLICVIITEKLTVATALEILTDCMPKMLYETCTFLVAIGPAILMHKLLPIKYAYADMMFTRCLRSLRSADYMFNA